MKDTSKKGKGRKEREREKMRESTGRATERLKLTFKMLEEMPA